ncbi:MAG: hypothetical protein ACJ0BI_01385 [Paracoccaceae bacterium]
MTKSHNKKLAEFLEAWDKKTTKFLTKAIWTRMTSDEKREISLRFTREIRKVTKDYLMQGFSPDIVQHVLVTEAMRMAFYISPPTANYMNVIAVALGAILVEVETKVPDSMYQTFEDTKKTQH